MGCDIHFVIERKFEDGWIGVYATGSGVRPAFHYWDRTNPNGKNLYITNANGYMGPKLAERNYSFFAALAGVRGDGPEAKGMPKDASELSHAMGEEWNSDGHSHSYDTLVDFVLAYLRSSDSAEVAKAVAEKLIDPEFLGKKIFELVGTYSDEGTPDDYRVVYWFDN